MCAARQSDYWMVTVFEGSEMWDPLCECLARDDPEAAARAMFPDWTFWCGQQEICPDTLNRHFQCYVEFPSGSRPRRLTVRNKGFKAHLDAREGNAQQAADYCQDGGKWAETPKMTQFFENLPARWSWGVMSVTEQGRRTDIERLREDLMAAERLPVRNIAERNFALWLRYNRGILGFIELEEKKRDWKTEVICLWGESETGKTAIAKAFARFKYGESIYYKNATKWWNGYQGEDCVIVDEFFGQWEHEQWKTICDRDPVLVETKGGMVPFLAKTIIFTSNICPLEWWPKVGPDRWHETRRRIDHNIHCIAFEYDAMSWTQTREEPNRAEDPWAFPETGPGQLWEYGRN